MRFRREAAAASLLLASFGAIAESCPIGLYALPDVDEVRKMSRERADLEQAMRDIVVRFDAAPKSRTRTAERATLRGGTATAAATGIVGGVAGARFAPNSKEITFKDGDTTVRMTVAITVDEKVAKEAYFREKQRKASESPIAAPIDEGDVVAVKRLIAAGVDVRRTPEFRPGLPMGWIGRAVSGWSAQAAVAQDSAAQVSIARRYIAVIEALLATGANPRDKYYGTGAVERIPFTLANGEHTPGAMQLAARLLDANAPIDMETDGRERSLLDGPAGANDVELLQMMMQHGRPTAAATNHALRAAFTAESWDVAARLMEAGADPNLPLMDGHSVLNKLDSMPRWMIQELIARKVNPNIEMTSRLTPLMWVMHDHELMKGFLDIGADPNAKAEQREGVTALHVALVVVKPGELDPRWIHYSGAFRPSNATLRAESVALLLKYGAKPDIADKFGRTALMVASPSDPKAIELLIGAGANINTKVNGLRRIAVMAGAQPLDPVAWALVDGNETLALALLRSRKANVSCAAPFYAAAGGANEALKALLDAKMNAKLYRVEDGDSPFIAAARAGHVNTMATLLDRHVATIDETTKAPPGMMGWFTMKLAWGVGPKELGYENTALMAAADGGHLDAVRLLVERGADINATDYVGRTALDHALDASLFSNPKGAPQVAAYLMEHGGRAKPRG